MTARTNRRLRMSAAIAALFAPFLVSAPAQAEAAPATLNSAFAEAAKTQDVPRDLLVALAYAETHLEGHNGERSMTGGYGVMHLVSRKGAHALEKAAKLTRAKPAKLRTDARANIRGGAALLRSYANGLGLDAKQRRDAGHWYGAVAKYSQMKNRASVRLYADTVYDYLGSGIQATTSSGEYVEVRPQLVVARRGPLAKIEDSLRAAVSPDYPPANWSAANSSNYRVANRPSSNKITAVVVHTTQGSYAGTISWFKNPAAKVSAHYVIRSRDGEITQMVRDKDIAWHAKSGNPYSVGIEHEGWVNDGSWYTDAMYRASAKLTRHLADKYKIPRDRKHIVGHSEVPGNDHTDPGPHWDWNKYMSLVNGDGDTWNTVVDNKSDRFTASSGWGTSNWSPQKHDADYRYAKPGSEADEAWFKVAIPEKAKYRVEVWYPSVNGYNNVTPYVVKTADGEKTVFVDQRSGGGRWKAIGEFTLDKADANLVAVSRKSTGEGLVIADAIRVART